MKIYFAASLQNNTIKKIELYSKIINSLSSYGDVLTEKIADKKFQIKRKEKNIPYRKIHNYDLNLLLESDIIVAEITTPSLGVGYEIGRALKDKKPALCLYNKNIIALPNISKMISGAPGIKIAGYNTFKDIELIIRKFLKEEVIKEDYFLSKKSWEKESEEGREAMRYFKEQEIDSSLRYPAKRRIRTIHQQLFLLKNFFPSLKAEITEGYQLPEFADGWIVFPKYSRVASDYNGALEKTFTFLQQQRPHFLNWRQGELGKEFLRLTRRTEKALSIFNKKFQGDFIAIPAQMGKRFLGKSARRSYILFKPNEFGLGPFEISVFLLTHPEWLSSDNDLGIDCIGCEYALYKHGYFKYILFFYFSGSILRFGDRWCGCPDKKFGPASGFLPKNLRLT